jgi:hypothetical protein
MYPYAATGKALLPPTTDSIKRDGAVWTRELA